MSRHALRLIAGIVEKALESYGVMLDSLERDLLDGYLLRQLDRAYKLNGEATGFEDPYFCRELEEKLEGYLKSRECKDRLTYAVQLWVGEWLSKRVLTRGKRKEEKELEVA